MNMAAKSPVQLALVSKPLDSNKLFAQETVSHGDSRDYVIRNGYVVIKGAIPTGPRRSVRRRVYVHAG